jgi:hypothetical protein
MRRGPLAQTLSWAGFYSKYGDEQAFILDELEVQHGN